MVDSKNETRATKIYPFLGTLFLFATIHASFGISRDDVIQSAETWLNPSVSYSQSSRKDGYRKDCSGYVSMAWNLTKPGKTTGQLIGVTDLVDKSDLKKGDILLRTGPRCAHTLIFYSWVNEQTKTHYWGYDQGSGGTVYRTVPYPYWPDPKTRNCRGVSAWAPQKYKNITG